MTREQIDALETWIVSIIRDHNIDAGVQEAIRRRQLKDDVIRLFEKELQP